MDITLRPRSLSGSLSTLNKQLTFTYCGNKKTVVGSA